MKIRIKTNTSPLSGHASHEVFFGNRLRGYQSGNIAVGLQHSFELRNHQTLPKKEVPFYTCKEFRALTLNVYFRVAYSVNIEPGTSFLEGLVIPQRQILRAPDLTPYRYLLHCDLGKGCLWFQVQYCGKLKRNLGGLLRTPHEIDTKSSSQHP